MSTVVGIAAPAFTIYSRVTRWDYRDFVATLHPVILVANAISFVVKIIFLTHIDTGDLPAWIWVVALATIFIGAWFGDRLNDRMSSEGMRRLATLLAFAGAATLLIQGAVQLVS